MKTINFPPMLIAIAAICMSGQLRAQETIIITLNVDLDQLNRGSLSKACSFTWSDNTEVLDNSSPEAFEILVNEDDTVIWEAISKSGEEIDIEYVDFDISGGKEKPFKDKKLLGNGNGSGKKKVKGKVQQRAKGNVYKYTIEFSTSGEVFLIDPKLKVGR